jgi:hypothetical protein
VNKFTKGESIDKNKGESVDKIKGESVDKNVNCIPPAV